MNRTSCILFAIIGTIIIGAIIVGFVLLSFVMLPFIALIAIAALIYYLVTRKGRKGIKVSAEEKVETVDGSTYTVFDSDEKEPSSKQDHDGSGTKEITNGLD
ncbi:MAG: hypothetical protein JSV25_08110 [Spirochaetota bacterium]|nr:MAG: hypothetical protein JSV25_08110 [Spirochaetota bacterium]